MYLPRFSANRRKGSTGKGQSGMSISAQQESFQTKTNRRGTKKNAECDIEIGVYGVCCAVLALFATGVALATAYISIQNPGCRLSTSFLSGTVETANSRHSTITQKVQNAVSTSDTSDFKYPPASCAAEQLSAIKRQLPDDLCVVNHPWRQECSFTRATNGCQSPEVMRHFYSQNSLPDPAKDNQPFLALIVGWTQDDAPVDAMYVGSRRNPKYNVYDEWESSLKSCRGALVDESNPPATRDTRVLVVEWKDDLYEQLQRLKTKMNFSDKELVLDNTNIEETSAPETLTDIVQSKLLSSLNSQSTDEQPIHYVELSGRELEYTILMRQMRGLLKRIRYLSFEYNWKGSWRQSDAKLSEVVQILQQDGLICYWAGDSDAEFGLWRITGCWQSYYDEKNWAHIACVNTLHDDVKGLGEQMERKFLETIAK